MVLVPVDDRRKRHAIEMAHRRLDRARRQPQLFAGTADRAQAGAVEAGVDQLADARQADATPECPRHHREARRAAVHLVDLPHHRHPAVAAFDEVSAFGERLARGRLLVIRDLIGLGLVDRLLHRGARRQVLLSEIRGHLRDCGVVVLGDALVEARLELGYRRAQARDGIAAERQQLHARGRFGRGRARDTFDGRDLAEEFTGAEVHQVGGLALFRAPAADATFLNQVQRPRGIALAINRAARLDGDRLELGEHDTSHRLWR